MRRIRINLQIEGNVVKAYNSEGNIISLSETLVNCLDLTERKKASFDIIFDEPYYKEIPFTVENYKKIKSGEITGRCMNRNGDEVVIYETDLEDKYPVLGRVKNNKSANGMKSFAKNGKTPSRNYTFDPLDLVLAVRMTDEEIESEKNKYVKPGQKKMTVQKEDKASEVPQEHNETPEPAQNQNSEREAESSSGNAQEEKPAEAPIRIEKQEA